jgi:hypothetical protein
MIAMKIVDDLAGAGRIHNRVFESFVGAGRACPEPAEAASEQIERNYVGAGHAREQKNQSRAAPSRGTPWL